MFLSELLTRLAQGELSNLSMSVDGEISEPNVPKVVSYVNEALLRLHSRFVLREDDVLVEMIDGVATYELKAQYAQSYEGEIEVPHRYIMDLGPKKFADDVVRITGAFDSLGNELELNNKLAPAGLFTPRPKVLQVPVPIPGQALSVQYQAKHPLLSGSSPEDLEAEIELPEVLVGGLTAYVGFMAFNFLGGAENMARASTFMDLYNNICLELEEKDGMGTETRTYSEVFEMRGFV